MIKLDSLSRWNHLAVGSVLTLFGDTQRRIRLNVNSPKRISLFISNEDGELVFLAAPDGRDVVEFAAGGNVKITTEDEDVFIYTSENEPTYSINEDAEVFTRIAERAVRNPDMEHMLYLQQVNMERRFAALAAGVQDQVAEAYNAGRNTAETINPPTAVVEPAPIEPEQHTDSSAPIEGA